jgi:hypothetical protein
MTTVDLPLFNAIVSDLFPGIEAPQIDYSKVNRAKFARTTFKMVLIAFL